jgi:RNA polymerase sigma factor (sigma-70 family)
MGALEFNNMLVSNSEFLRPFAITLTRDSEGAKDLFQETIYRAIANREKYNVGTNIKAWLYTIMRNIFINNYRRRAKQNTIIDTSPNEFLLDSHQGINQYTTEAKLNVKDMMASVYHLPEIFRNPFLLYFDGFRYHEIAGMLQEPLGTIKSRIHFARKILKEEVQRY